MDNLISILKDAGANVKLEVSGEDLLEFSNELINRAKRELSAQEAEARKEKYLTKEEVKHHLDHLLSSVLVRLSPNEIIRRVLQHKEINYSIFLSSGEPRSQCYENNDTQKLQSVDFLIIMVVGFLVITYTQVARDVNPHYNLRFAVLIAHGGDVVVEFRHSPWVFSHKATTNNSDP